jgi:hypothetical protein
MQEEERRGHAQTAPGKAVRWEGQAADTGDGPASRSPTGRAPLGPSPWCFSFFFGRLHAKIYCALGAGLALLFFIILEPRVK